MKLAAAHAIAALAREPIPASVLRAYNLEKLEFGRSYLIPKPLDPRLLCTVATAVARAAVESGVAAPARRRLGCLCRAPADAGRIAGNHGNTNGALRYGFETRR